MIRKKKRKNPDKFKQLAENIVGTPENMIKKKKRKNPQRLKDLLWEYYIPLPNCINSHVYYASGRGISFGIYKDDGIFIGLRDYGLVNEYHWDLGPPMGTVRPILDLEILPKDIKSDKEILKYLKQTKQKYWPLIWPEEELRKEKFHKQLKKEEEKAEKDFGPYKDFCKNCETITDKSWTRCPNCKKLSGFGNQMLLRLKDNKLYSDIYDINK